MSLGENSVIKREFNGNRSVPSNFMSDIEYSVITNDVIKSFDCIYKCPPKPHGGISLNFTGMILGWPPFEVAQRFPFHAVF